MREDKEVREDKKVKGRCRRIRRCGIDVGGHRPLRKNPFCSKFMLVFSSAEIFQQRLCNRADRCL